MILNRLIPIFSLGTLTTIIALTLPFERVNYLSPPVLAQAAPGYEPISQNKATATITTTFVYPGRITTLDFSKTGETIIYILLGDPSQVVYTTDFPLESNAATAVFLKPIQPLKFSGATRTSITNLIVKTTSSLYNFRLVHGRGAPSHLGIQITQTNPPTTQKTIALDARRVATLNDIEIGLRYAIINGYTSPDDPVVRKVRNFIAIAQNEPVTIAQAAQQAGLDLAVIVELGKIAFEKFISTETQSK